MNEPRATAIAIPSGRPWTSSVLQGAGNLGSRALNWAGETAQQFGVIVSTLMGPAIVSTYALATWSLAQNLGWTNTFLFNRGPLSNWLVWFVIAGSVTAAAEVLKRKTQVDK